MGSSYWISLLLVYISILRNAFDQNNFDCLIKYQNQISIRTLHCLNDQKIPLKPIKCFVPDFVDATAYAKIRNIFTVNIMNILFKCAPFS